MSYNFSPELKGSYKLSKTIIDKINQSTRSISNNELLSVIYFTQICDISGYIDDFKISDLKDIIGCSRRAAYNIINNLVEKNFISISGSTWTGCRNITLLDNDFTNSTERYLNTNFTFLTFTHNDYVAFKELSLFAKKTLLIVLFNYQLKYGYHVSIETLRKYIGVTTKTKVLKYVNELKNMFDASLITVSGSKKQRIKYGMLYIQANVPVFCHESGIKDYQPCYIKRSYMNLFKNSNIEFDSINKTELYLSNDILRKHLQSLYSLTVSYISKGFSFDQIQDEVLRFSLYNKEINEYTLYLINRELEQSLNKCG